MRFRNDAEIIWKIVFVLAPFVIVGAIVAKWLGWTP